MRNVNITHHPRISLQLTAQDWALYTTMSGADEAAKQINKRVEFAINNNENRNIAASQIATALQEQMQFGATDTEPLVVARQLLDLAYPHTTQ